MKLGTVRVTGAERVAVAVDDEADAHVLLLEAGLTLSGLIGDWAAARPAVERAVGQAATRADQQVPVSELDWLPPVPARARSSASRSTTAPTRTGS